MRFIAILSSLAMSTTALAAQDIVCTIKSGGQGFMSPVIVFGLPTADQPPYVFDAVIEMAKGEPMLPKVKSRSGSKLRYRWTVSGIPARPSPATVGYWADLDTAAMTVTVSGSIRGFDNDIKGRGNCEKR